MWWYSLQSKFRTFSSYYLMFNISLNIKTLVTTILFSQSGQSYDLMWLQLRACCLSLFWPYLSPVKKHMTWTTALLRSLSHSIMRLFLCLYNSGKWAVEAKSKALNHLCYRRVLCLGCLLWAQSSNKLGYAKKSNVYVTNKSFFLNT